MSNKVERVRVEYEPEGIRYVVIYDDGEEVVYHCIGDVTATLEENEKEAHDDSGPDLCGQCNGSGEGMMPDSRCHACHGTGMEGERERRMMAWEEAAEAAYDRSKED